MQSINQLNKGQTLDISDLRVNKLMLIEAIVPENASTPIKTSKDKFKKLILL